jgi:hypothetical protein
VEAKSRLLAEAWGDKSYIVDSSYLTKIETGQRSVINMSMAKMISTGEILSKGTTTLFNLCRPPRTVSLVEDFLGGPAYTQYVREGRLAEAFSAMLVAAFPEGSFPDSTQLVAIADANVAKVSHPFQDKKRYIRAIVGRTDLCIFPLIVPGSFLVIDREFTAVPNERYYDNELQRPIFLVHTHEGYFCCWCDLVGAGEMVKIVQHPLGALPNKALLQPLKLKHQIEIVGTVAFSGTDRRPYLKS